MWGGGSKGTVKYSSVRGHQKKWKEKKDFFKLGILESVYILQDSATVSTGFSTK
jgi:hypothetical protein